jgi:hypothetical protein
MSATNLLIGLDQFAAGSLFGAQLVWTFSVIPVFRLLNPSDYVKSHTLLTWYGDALMPVLGLSTCVLGFIRYNRTGQWSALASALALTLASIAASRNLDINKRMRDIKANADETPEQMADELVGYRKKWATQHFIRHFGGFLAFVFALIVPTTVMTFGRKNIGPFGFVDLIMLVVIFMVGREIVAHTMMMRRRGALADMATSLGIDSPEAP